MSDRSISPVVLVERNGYRLVRQFRDDCRWPGLLDLTLERQALTAMGDLTWVRVNSWCVGPQEDQSSDRLAHTDMVLLMLLDAETPLFKVKP